MLKFSALSLAVVASAALFGQSVGTSKQALRTAYESIAGAYNTGNIDAVTAWMAPDFKWTMLDGKVVKKDSAKASIQSELSSVQQGHWHIDMLNTVVMGQIATVVAQYRFDGTLLDPQKKAYKATLITTERQNWIRNGTTWQIVTDEMLNQKTFAGGLKTLPNVNSDQSGAPGTGGSHS